MQLFVLTNFAVVTLLLYLIMRDRKKRPGVKMNFDKKTPLDFSIKDIFKGRERQLNVLFNFNGETFDAYQVLGLPAGSPREMVEQAFHSSEKSDLMKAAYQAITGP